MITQRSHFFICSNKIFFLTVVVWEWDCELLASFYHICIRKIKAAVYGESTTKQIISAWFLLNTDCWIYFNDAGNHCCWLKYDFPTDLLEMIIFGPRHRRTWGIVVRFIVAKAKDFPHLQVPDPQPGGSAPSCYRTSLTSGASDLHLYPSIPRRQRPRDTEIFCLILHLHICW